MKGALPLSLNYEEIIMKKPDNVSDNPLTTTFGTNVSAPAITLPDIEGFKSGEGARARLKLKAKLEELQAEYVQLMEQAEHNDLLYSAEIRFVPSMGKAYDLYQRDDESVFLSMVRPEEWGPNYRFNHVGTFKQLTSSLWEKV